MRASGPLIKTPVARGFAHRWLFVAHSHVAERIRGVARPIVFWPKTYVAIFVPTLMVVAERITTGLSLLFIEPAFREDATSCLDTHHCRAGAGIFDRSSTLETRLAGVFHCDRPYNIAPPGRRDRLTHLFVRGGSFFFSLIVESD
jgi:hypothetical protein